jgi:hypothetical protein
MFRRLAGLDKMHTHTKTAPRCLLLALISFPLNVPKRQGIGIFSSSQMGKNCLQDNSLCTFIFIDLIMEHIYMRIPIGKWSIDL